MDSATINTVFIVVILVLLAAFSAGVWLFLQRLKNFRDTASEDKSALLLQQQIQELTRTVDQKLSDTTKTLQEHTLASAKMVQDQFVETSKITRDITERLAKLDETNKQVLVYSDQLQKLRDILQNPKQRGVFGEYYLETLLKNAFNPKQYRMQYEFKDGLTVDAVLFVGDKLIPIDSKFSLENYNRIAEERDPVRREKLEQQFKQDLKKRIDETAKYIRPAEGTTDFAYMFIPAEGVYYDLLVNEVGTLKVNTRDLIDYAIVEKKVHIVSPTTFYVAIQSYVQTGRMYQIQESTKEVIKRVGLLDRHLKAYEEYMRKLGTHLNTAVNFYNTATGEFAKIDKDVLKITGRSPELSSGDESSADQTKV